MNVSKLEIPDVLLLTPKVFQDARGSFFESFNLSRFSELLGRDIAFVQDNQSQSHRNVIRGLHYQVMKPQGKLVRVVRGSIFDVAVDLRRNSPTFGKWVGEVLSSENLRQLWVPEGFAHGFMALSEAAEVQYKVTEYWYPEYDRCIRFDDETLSVGWPVSSDVLKTDLVLSDKDRAGRSFLEADVF